jgi:hypothetical protein
MKYTIDKHDRYIVIEPHVDVIDADNAAKLKGVFVAEYDWTTEYRFGYDPR